MALKTQTLLKYIISISITFLLFSCKEETPLKKNNTVVKSNVTPHNEVKDTLDISLEFITGHFNPPQDSSFVVIERKYADRKGMYMKREAYQAFIKMWHAAQGDNINLVIRSAARNFDYQKGIWERKWTGKTLLSNGKNAAKDFNSDEERALKILEYSSMPGSSRHHWGTDIDFNNFNNEWFESGEGLKLFTWLEKYAADYGFCRPYTEKNTARPHGYNEEKWHWSYMPLSQKYTAFAQKHLNNTDIKGFKGSDVATNIDVVEHYVLGINHKCK